MENCLKTEAGTSVCPYDQVNILLLLLLLFWKMLELSFPPASILVKVKLLGFHTVEKTMSRYETLSGVVCLEYTHCLPRR